jgi:signal transduction histidine kinase
LLDVDMPDMSGFEVCRRLKADEGLGSIPVIFLTGSVGTEDKVKGLDLGGVDYVAKPFDAFELRARVRAALRTKQLQDEVARAEKELRSLNESLERQVAERTANVQALLRQKNDFIHQLGHDLKTPLTPLVGLLPLLDRRVADPESKRIVQLAIENVAYMKKLVERTLRLAQISVADAKVLTESVNLCDETNRAVSALSDRMGGMLRAGRSDKLERDSAVYTRH